MAVLVSCFFGSYAGAVVEEIFPVTEATARQTDASVFYNQQYVPVNTQVVNTITLLKLKTQAMTRMVISTSTVNPTPQGQLNGVVTSTYPNSSTLEYVTFFTSSTAGDIPISLTAGQIVRFFSPNNINYYYAPNSTTYTNASGWDKFCTALNPYSCTASTFDGDLWFSINGFSQSGSNISFVDYPTSTCDFQVWPTQQNISATDFATYPFMGGIVSWGYAEGQEWVNDNSKCNYYN